MKKHIVLLSLFTFLGCQNNKTIFSPTLSQIKRELIDSVDARGEGQFRTRIVSNREDVNENKIVNIQLKKNRLRYTVQGWFASSGLSARKMTLTQEKNVENDVLVLTHKMQVKSIPGKESNLVYGYNFLREHTVSLKSSHTKVVIRLINSKGEIADEQIISLQK